MNLPWDNNSWEIAAQAAARRQKNVVISPPAAGLKLSPSRVVSAVGIAAGSSTVQAVSEVVRAEPPKEDVHNDRPQLLLQTVVNFGDETDDGQIIEAVALPWFDIIEALKKNWTLAYELDPRKLEEIVAGAYQKDGFEVVLTPRSHDHGRDVIATKKGVGFGSIRVVDQVKRYGPKHLVTADEVRSMIGVLGLDPGASKAFITTTSDFAPKIRTDEKLAPLMPARLELINGAELLKKLEDIARGGNAGY